MFCVSAGAENIQFQKMINKPHTQDRDAWSAQMWSDTACSTEMEDIQQDSVGSVERGASYHQQANVFLQFLRVSLECT